MLEGEKPFLFLLFDVHAPRVMYEQAVVKYENRVFN